MTKKERLILKKILENQELLRATLRELHITQPSDLSNVHQIMRRGLVQTVGDIFELANQLSDGVNSQIPWRREIIKQFRNAASHRYSQIENEFAFAFLMHCTDKDLMKSIKTLSS
jgi:hypothetical protein